MSIRGEKCSLAKLTESEVVEMRMRWDAIKERRDAALAEARRLSSTGTLEMLADDYQVTVGCIKRVVFRETWGHIA